MGKQMIFREAKWAPRRINGEYGSFVTGSVQKFSYPGGKIVSLAVKRKR